MVLLCETYKCKHDDPHPGAKMLNFSQENFIILRFKFYYSGIDLKLWNITEINIFCDISKLWNSQLLVHEIASYIWYNSLYIYYVYVYGIII
jgi:hypothetical protein